jgi:protease PrsW
MSLADRYPRYLTFVFGALSLMTLVLVVLMLAAEEIGGGGIAAGLALACLPVPVYLAVVFWIDRYEPEPPWMLAVTFAWGATAAVLLSVLFTGLAEAAALGVLDHPSAEFAALVFTAPLVEELAKAAALVLLFAWKPHEFDNVTDGIVYAVMVGLGFAMTENVLYYAWAAGDAREVGTVLVLRGVLSPFAHPFFTSMVGIGLGLVRQADSRDRHLGPPAVGLAGAVSLHVLWNLAATYDRFLGVYAFVMVPLFAAVLLLLAASLRREVEIVRLHLGPEVERGQLPVEELETLCSARRRMAASLAAWQVGGRAGWSARRAYHHALTELAFHRWRVGRGDSAGERADALRERTVLDRVATLRGALPLTAGRLAGSRAVQ